MFFCITTYVLPSDLLLYTHQIAPHPFFCRYFLQMILSDHLNHPCQLPGFFRPDMHHKISETRPLLLLFRLFFRSTRVPAPQCFHKNPYAPSHTHTNRYVSYPQKHDVRGNFPGHRAQIRACMIIFVPACIVYVSPHVPCTPTHPYKPIRTHLHLFVPVCTLCFHVYMYNLIKK